MKTPSQINRNQALQRGFTLVEILVAMTVLSLIIALVAELMNGTTRTIATSTKQVDEDDAARTVFNLMANDFTGMLKRSDVDYFFYKNNGTTTTPGNDTMWFYSNAPAYLTGAITDVATESDLTVVGYRVPTIDNRPDSAGSKDGRRYYTLERAGRPVQWVGSNIQAYLTGPAPTAATPNPTPYAATAFIGRPALVGNGIGSAPYTDGDWRGTSCPSYIVSDQVFRLEFCFIKKDGTSMIPRTPTTGKYEDVNTPAYTDMRLVGTDVRAIVVAIALLDKKSRVISSNLLKAAAALPDVKTSDLTASPPKLMAETWNEEIKNGNFAKNSGLPPTVASQVRIFQRTFLIGAK